MPSSYTSSLRLTLPATGELSGSWGVTVNNGITSLTDAAVAGTTTINTWGGAGVPYTLTVSNGATDEARRMFIVATGAPGEAKDIICPAVSKLYFVTNSVTGGFDITFKTAAGTGVVVPNGQSMLLRCDGTNVINGVTSFASPALTGVPTAPTATVGTATDQIATTSFVAATSFSTNLPGQTGNAGKYLGTDGTNASWSDVYPSQTGNAGEFLTTDGSAVSWAQVYPTQTGNAGKFLTTDGTSPDWASLPSASLQEFSISGTWTKPAGANFVMVELWGAGGGGGSGRRGTAGTERYGGSGGGGGAYGFRLFKASDLGATEAVTIGAGGTGGAAVTVDSTNGVEGTAGGTSSFGAWLSIYGGNGGGGGSTSAGSFGGGGGVLASSGNPQNLDGSGSGGSEGQFGRGNSASNSSGFGGGNGGTSPSGSGGSSYQGGPAGGGGGQISSTNGYSSPGSGGGIVDQSGSGAQRGVFPGTAGASGTGRQGGAGGTVGSVTIDSCVDVTFGNGTFAGVSSGGLIRTSSNGTNNWVAQTGPSNLPVQRLMHDGTQFVLFDTSSRVWTTTDFITYTARANGPWAGTIGKVRYQNSRYFVVRAATNGVYTSTDLVTWTQVTSGNGGQTYDICWTGTNYVVVSGSSPAVRYSSDLVTWSTATGAGVPNNSYTCTSNGSGTVVINANSGSIAQEVSRSTDHGQTFTAASTTLTGAQTSSNTASYHGGTYFLVWSSNLWTSSDGSSWTQRSTSSGLFGTVGYDGTTLAVGDGDNSTTTAAYTSTLGGLGTWTSRTLTAINVAGGAGGAGGQPGGGGGGGGPSTNSNDSGAGGNGGDGYARIYTW